MKQIELMQEQARVMARVAEQMTAAAFAESERGSQQVMAMWRESLDSMQEALRQLAAADLRDPKALVRTMSRQQMERAARLQTEATSMFEQGLAFQSRLGEILRNSSLELGAALSAQETPAMGLGPSFVDAWKQSMDTIRVNFERFEMPAANVPASPKARRSSGSLRAKAA